MKPVTAPLTLGQTGADVVNLQDILLLLISKGYIDVHGNEGIVNHISDERSQQLFGDATNAVIGDFRTQYSITGDSGDQAVNPGTVAVLNEKLALANPETLTISGMVTHASGKKLQDGYSVYFYALTYPTPTEITHQVVTNGTYSRTLTMPLSMDKIELAKSNGVRIVVRADGSSIDLAKQDITLITGDIVANLTVDSADAFVETEYTQVKNAIQTVIGSAQITDIDLDDAASMEILMNRTEETSQHIRFIVTALRWAQLIPAVAPESFYAVLRQNCRKISRLWAPSLWMYSTMRLKVQKRSTLLLRRMMQHFRPWPLLCKRRSPISCFQRRVQ